MAHISAVFSDRKEIMYRNKVEAPIVDGQKWSKVVNSKTIEEKKKPERVIPRAEHKDEKKIVTEESNKACCAEPKMDTPTRRVGFLKMILGPMFAGKTTLLKTELGRYADSAFQNGRMVRPLLITSLLDDRKVTSHGGITSHASDFKGLSDRIDVIRARDLSGIDVKDREIIGVDEMQFFGVGTANVIRQWKNQNKYVIVSSLSGDSNQNIFGEAHLLMGCCDDFDFRMAACLDCKEYITSDAPFTFKLAGGSGIDVGGADKYIPLCQYHYNVRFEQLAKQQSS